MIKVGITGNIGSGKSTVAKLFSLLGVPVYEADSRAKDLMVSEPSLRAEITHLFGKEAYLDNGSLNRAYIAQLVFHDARKLGELNALVHPAVFKDFNSWLNQQAQTELPYVVKEAALLVESGSYKDLDYLILVQANEELRIKRTLERDKTNVESVKARIKNQFPEDQKVPFAQFFIQNNDDLIIPQVLQIHKALLLLSGKNG